MKNPKKTKAERFKRLTEALKGGVGDKGLATAPKRVPAIKAPAEKLGLGPVSKDGVTTNPKNEEFSDQIASVADLRVSVLKGDDNDLYYRFEVPGRSTVVASVEVIGQRIQALTKLRRIGILASSDVARRAIGDLIEAAHFDPETIVATHTGFERVPSPRYFIYRDGSVISGDANLRVISLLEGDIRFGSAGDLRAYEEGIAKVVRNQSVPTTVFFFGLAQVVKPFVTGTGYKSENAMFELVGRSTVYKSALTCTLAGSAWGRAPEPNGSMEYAYARTWNMTPEKIGDFFAEYNGHLLILDEATMAHSEEKKRAEKIMQVVHRMSSGLGRARHGEGTQGHSLTMLSTSNQPIQQILAETEDVRRAVEGRLISFQLPNEEPNFFDSVPQGFLGVEAAMKHVFAIVGDNYGLLARRFIADVLRFIATDSARLTPILEGAISKFLRNIGMDASGVDPVLQRRAQPFALAYATAVVAFLVGTLDKKNWGRVKRTIRRAWTKHGLTGSRSTDGDPRIVSYMLDQSNIFVDARRGNKPRILDHNFRRIAGIFFVGKDRTLCLAIPVAAKSKLGMSTATLKHLKRKRDFPRTFCN
jgi:hypothetical protein